MQENWFPAQIAGGLGRESVKTTYHEQRVRVRRAHGNHKEADAQGEKDITIYFADSYASWQKGAIKNANKHIGKYISKKYTSMISATD